MLWPRPAAPGSKASFYIDKLAAARPPDLLDFLDGGPRPRYLEFDLCIDLGVVEFLRRTRANPPAEQPEAADAGFLGMTRLWVQYLDSTREWFEPQAGLYYRWLGAFWRITAQPAPSPFRRRVVRLRAGDDFFGPEFREILAAS